MILKSLVKALAHSPPWVRSQLTKFIGVSKLLNGLNIHKASGPDGLSQARVLKECTSEIAPILALIYNESLSQGRPTVPHDFRQANVARFSKKGETYDAANYRPVSLICICTLVNGNV